MVINKAELRRIVRSPAGPIVSELMADARKVQARARRNVNRNTGQLAASIDVALSFEGNHIVVRIGSDKEYAQYIHEGTGLFGPKRAWIYPVHKKFLKFESKGTFGPVRAGQGRAGRGGIVFARRVAGVPKNPFLVEALEAESRFAVRRT